MDSVTCPTKPRRRHSRGMKKKNEKKNEDLLKRGNGLAIKTPDKNIYGEQQRNSRLALSNRKAQHKQGEGTIDEMKVLQINTSPNGPVPSTDSRRENLDRSGAERSGKALVPGGGRRG